jgi:hypothetical protein
MRDPSLSKILMPKLLEEAMTIMIEDTISECDNNVATLCVTTFSTHSSKARTSGQRTNHNP